MSHVGRALPAALLAPLLMGAAVEVAAGQSVEGPGAANAASADYAKTSEFTMLVEDQGIMLGEALVVGSTDGSVRIERKSFLLAIRGALRAEAYTEFESALPADEHLDLAMMKAAGIPVRYDPEDLKLNVDLKVEQRPRGVISGTLGPGVAPDTNLAPAMMSGYINAHFGVGYEREEGQPGQFEYPAILIEGAARWAGVVVEVAAQLGTDGTFARQNTRVVYDLPESAMRVSAGDLALRPMGLFAIPPIMGVALQKSYADLQPASNIRPTGKRSFRIEQTSEVVVMVNGQEARRLHLQAGEYDLDDLPLTSGTNDVQLKIRDEFGKEGELDFSILHNRMLLDPGISEWTLAAGTRVNAGLVSPSYEEAPVAVTQYRQGITENLTGNFTARSSERTALVGAGVLSQTPFGLLSMDAALSGGDEAELGWSIAGEIELDSKRLWAPLSSAQFGLELTGEHFVSGLDQAPSEGAHARISGSVGHRLGARTSASISGYYQLAEEELDRGFGAGFSLNRVLSDDLALGVSGNYDERGVDDLGATSGLSVFARLNYRPSRQSYAALEYQYANHTGGVSAGTSHDEGATRTSVSVAWEHTPSVDDYDQHTQANVDLYHVNDRFEVNASHGRQFDRPASGTRIRRSTANVGVGVGFADSKLAFGRPVRGGFAIIDTHASLDGSAVRVDAFDDLHKAASDGLGPLLVSDISAYSPTHITYEVDDLPAGYDVGSGVLTFVAPYKAGYAIEIGSDFPVTALGKLLDEEGKPLVMKAGTASASAHPEKTVVFFTNASGNFTLQGLKGGDWNIVINEDPRRFRARIPEGATGYVELGELQPHG